MSQDVVSDALNQIMNSKRVEKNEVRIKRVSKILIRLFEIMKDEGHIDFDIHYEGGNKKKPEVIIKLLKINECHAIKPRYSVGVEDINKYLRRFLPSRNFGKLIISTSRGLMNQHEAYEAKIGGSLIAYFY